MSVQTLMTVAEFERVAGRLGPCELVRGEVVELSPDGLWHNRISANVSGIMAGWCRPTGLGRVAAGDVGLIVGPDTVRGADVVYYSYERLPKGSAPEGFSTVPPNLVVEVVGKGQGWGGLLEKAGEYLRMGVDRVWIIDPKTRRLHICRADAEPVALGEGESVADEAVLPGLGFLVSEIFTD